MRRVKLDDPARGGVLGHAGILTVTSFPHRTSPVLRGRWVLEELLGAEVPPPPPDVPVLNERTEGRHRQLTLRQQLEKHRAKAECASCHARMDPLGFGLENFDPLGRWRTEQGGQPVDSSGVLPTGEKFSGPAELKKLLLEKRRPEFLRNLSPQGVRIRFGPGDQAGGHGGGPGLRAGPGAGRVPHLATAGSDRAELPVFAPKPEAVSRAMGVKSKPLSRRTFLRGAGVALGLPLLEAMLPARARGR